ncbi:hypothetical protein BGZ51_008983 [Haplosporangium sp. Z 767]|nr:hypothetical protein BGZ51_008983 [Haplosporangium sp. Z 767]
MITLSVTSIRFAVPNLQSYRNVTSSVFEEQNELLLAMEDSIADGTFSNITGDPLDGMMVMEAKSIGSNVEALACKSRRAGVNGNPYLMCLYTTVSTIIVESQPMLTEISDLRGDKSFPVQPNISVIIDVRHLPLTSNGNQSFFPTSSIANASTTAAEYFASLGQNFFMDWDDKSLYVIYDTSDLEKGYEIPTWLFVSVIAVMVACLLLRVFTEFRVDARDKGSLYRVVSKELESRLRRPTPTMMRFMAEPLTFEGYRIALAGTPLVPKDDGIHEAPVS